MLRSLLIAYTLLVGTPAGDSVRFADNVYTDQYGREWFDWNFALTPGQYYDRMYIDNDGHLKYFITDAPGDELLVYWNTIDFGPVDLAEGGFDQGMGSTIFSYIAPDGSTCQGTVDYEYIASRNNDLHTVITNQWTRTSNCPYQHASWSETWVVDDEGLRSTTGPNWALSRNAN